MTERVAFDGPTCTQYCIPAQIGSVQLGFKLELGGFQLGSARGDFGSACIAKHLTKQAVSSTSKPCKN